MYPPTHRRKRPRLDLQNASTSSPFDRSARRYAEKPRCSDTVSRGSSVTLSPGPSERSSHEDDKEEGEDEESHAEAYQRRLDSPDLYHHQLYRHHLDRYCNRYQEHQSVRNRPLLSTGDIVELLDPEELRNILVAEAHRHPTVSASLAWYFTLTRKQRRVSTFEKVTVEADMYSIKSVSDPIVQLHLERRQCLSAISAVTVQVGPNSSWPTKLNAICTLRLQGKTLERRGMKEDLLFDDVREGIWKVLECLSDADKTKLFDTFGPLHLLMNFKINLIHDRDSGLEFASNVPDWNSWPDNRSLDVLSLGATASQETFRLESGAKSADQLLREAREDRDRNTKRCDDLCLEDPADHTNECAFRLIYGHRLWSEDPEDMDQIDEASEMSEREI